MKYIKVGNGPSLVLLHGWGCKKEIFNDLIERFKNSFTVWAIDLPGFGETKLEYPMTIDDYSEKLREFFEYHKINKPIILGHSFGGRVSIRFASRYYCEKLILVDSAGIKRINYKVIRYKIIKKTLTFLRMKNTLNRMRDKYSSEDYKNASDIMRETLKLAVNYDQRNELKRITCETLVIWGKEDKATKVNDGYLMNKLLFDSGIVVFEDAGHFPFIEKKKRFAAILSSFITGGD